MDTPSGQPTAPPRDETRRLRTEARLQACLEAALADGDPALVALIRGIIARTCGGDGAPEGTAPEAPAPAGSRSAQE